MVSCKKCARYFTAEHDGKKFEFCDMDCYCECLNDTIDDLDCDWYEHVDSNDTKNGNNEA